MLKGQGTRDKGRVIVDSDAEYRKLVREHYHKFARQYCDETLSLVRKLYNRRREEPTCSKFAKAAAESLVHTQATRNTVPNAATKSAAGATANVITATKSVPTNIILPTGSGSSNVDAGITGIPRPNERRILSFANVAANSLKVSLTTRSTAPTAARQSTFNTASPKSANPGTSGDVRTSSPA